MPTIAIPNRFIPLLILKCLLLIFLHVYNNNNTTLHNFCRTITSLLSSSFSTFTSTTIIITPASNNTNNDRNNDITTNPLDNNNNAKYYGIDVSFPIHDMTSFNNNKINKIQQKRYKNFMNGCIKRYDSKSCKTNENIRLQHNSKQPILLKNYTYIGYKKMKVPNDLYKLLYDYFRSHYDNDNIKEESWSIGNTYTNHWLSKTYILPIPKSIQSIVLNRLEPYMKQWISQKLLKDDKVKEEGVKVSSIYGIRIYKSNSILVPHVDRLPLISSVIINIDQDVDDPWPLEVYGHTNDTTKYYARNITLLPGEMIFYESHTVVHGRPYPLHGRYYANLFIHYEPIGFNKSYNHIPIINNNENDKDKFSSTSTATTITSAENQNDYNSNINLYLAASYDDIITFQNIITNTNNNNISLLLFKPDKYGWYVLHEASRAGSYNIIQYLLQYYYHYGATTTTNDNIINVRTNFGYGGTALYWAMRKRNENNNNNHQKIKYYENIINLLIRYGGISIEPEGI